jgi:hypothetical protein
MTDVLFYPAGSERGQTRWSLKIDRATKITTERELFASQIHSAMGGRDDVIVLGQTNSRPKGYIDSSLLDGFGSLRARSD